MKGIFIRAIVIILTFLLTITWFPYSLLPLWILVCILNFFGLREGLIFFVSFGVLGISVGLSWFTIPSITVLWLAVTLYMAITNISHTKKLNIITCIGMALGISVMVQIWGYRGHIIDAFPVLLWTSFKHLFLIVLLIFPTKILGEAYARYLNALGINYE